MENPQHYISSVLRGSKYSDSVTYIVSISTILYMYIYIYIYIYIYNFLCVCNYGSGAKLLKAVRSLARHESPRIVRNLPVYA